MKHDTSNLSMPVRKGGGYVIHEQRDDRSAIESHILPTYADALAYRRWLAAGGVPTVEEESTQ